eukprot:TRINITY_DN807_c0_g2_i3.p1 TRINITY_DN807_c0_g2~~TRINITY_DN807_c0_g2_i3.p1  ORF type:complete len:377 (-),score=65.72 TRINITY_DN807_c0_g2_i3:98-1228(-)
MDVDAVDLEVSNDAVMEKYKAAGDVANRVMVAVLEYIQPGQNVVEICAYGDKLIDDLCQTTYKKLTKKDKGIAFPTCVSINNCAGHFSPLPEDPPVVISAGDLIKVDLGVQIGGYASVCAHTWIVGQTEPATGRMADAVCAAYYASECALKLIRPGKTNKDVTNIIALCCKTFNVEPLEGVLSHQMKHKTVDANNVIINREEQDQKVEEFTFEMYQVYALDVVVSSGEGRTKEMSTRTTVFKRAVDRSYQLKLQTSRLILKEINEKYPHYAFPLRALDEKKRRMGIVEIVKHELVDSYPVLYEKEGQYIAQFKFTVVILPSATVRLNGPFPLPHVSSEYSIDTNPEIGQVMQMSLERRKKRKKNKGGEAQDGMEVQ